MPALFAVPLAVLAVVLVLVTFPVSLPLIALLDTLDRRRLRAAARGTRCARCGHVLGTAALAAADDAYRAELADAHRRHPYAIVDMFRRAFARCTACGAEYGWEGRPRGLRLLPADPLAHAASPGVPPPLLE